MFYRQQWYRIGQKPMKLEISLCHSPEEVVKYFAHTWYSVGFNSYESTLLKYDSSLNMLRRLLYEKRKEDFC